MVFTGGARAHDQVADDDHDTWLQQLWGLPTRDVEDWLCACVEDIDARDDRGWTLLHHAVAERALTVVEVLTRWTHDIDVRDRAGYTPLGRAVASFPWTPEIVDMLLARGADPIRAVLGGTPPPPTPPTATR